MKQELKTKLKELINERHLLTEEIEKIEKEIRNDSSFIEKLDLWYNSEDGIKLSYMPSNKEYPNLKKWINNLDYQPRGVCDLREYFEDEILGLIDGDINESEIKEISLNVIKECIEKNLHNFEWDW